MNHMTRNFLSALFVASVFIFVASDVFAANRALLGNASPTVLAASADAHVANSISNSLMKQ